MNNGYNRLRKGHKNHYDIDLVTSVWILIMIAHNIKTIPTFYDVLILIFGGLGMWHIKNRLLIK